MKFTLLTSFTTVLLVLAGIPAWADGLLYQLPEDGTWVQFASKVTIIRGDQMRNGTGTLRMSSVGTATEGGENCRWIEFNLTMKIDDNERTIVAKLLVPEAHLEEGQKPIENLERGWIRMRSDGTVRELTAQNLGPLPAFLANPLTDVKALPSEVVSSKLGDLSCAGLTGITEFVERNASNKVDFETRRHEKAPFGVVKSRMKVTVTRDGGMSETLDMDMTVSEFGKSAKSELPNNN